MHVRISMRKIGNKESRVVLFLHKCVKCIQIAFDACGFLYKMYIFKLGMQLFECFFGRIKNNHHKF